MYNDIIDLAMDQQLISAKKTKIKTDYRRLPIWNELRSKTEQEIRAFEDKLEDENNISFNILFNEPIGYYFIALYLQSQDCIDKAVFIRDVAIFKSLHNYTARKIVSNKIFFTFCAPESDTRIKGTSCIQGANLNYSAKDSISETPSSKNSLPSANDKITDTASDITEFSNTMLYNKPNSFINSRSHSDRDNNEQNAMDLMILKNSFSDSIAYRKHPLSIDVSVDDSDEKEEQKEQPIEDIFFIGDSNAIGCTGKPLKKLKERMIAGDVDANMFDGVVQQILSDLRLDIFPRFLKCSFFDMYLECKLFIELSSVSVLSFHSMRMLGRGAFGSVNACMKKDTGKLYAMKKIDKRRVQETDAVASLIAEKTFLSLMDSKFVTSLKYAFMDNCTLYLIMDLMSGGDLKYHLNQYGVFEEKRARFYCAQILLGLQHIHSKNIIYRDLKLENVLLDAFGNVKISDLGLAISQTSNECIRGYAGTPGYTAPRVVLTQYYDEMVDFFSYGVIIYRSLCGRKPFGDRMKQKVGNKRNANQSVELDRNVVEINPPFDSSRFTAKSRNLCRGLLQKNSQNRLGCNGYDEIKQHPFFDAIDWGLLQSGFLKPPFVPVYDEIYAEQQQHIGPPPKDDKYTKIEIKKEFNESLKGFAFKSSKIIQAEIVDLLKQSYHDQKNKSANFDVNQFVFPSLNQEVEKRNCLAVCVIV